MAAVSLLNVTVRNNPAPFLSPYEFEITFECLESLSKDLEWKLTYVGSATSSEHDQELDSLLVGPIPVGVNKFVFEADPPDRSRIPDTEVLGVTVILLTCSYDGREFVRVGYYVNNEYSEEALVNEPPQKVIIEKVQRNILAEKPRVTRFAIKWDSEESAPAEFPPEQPEVDAAEEDGLAYGAEEEEDEEEELEAEANPEEATAAEGQDADMAEAADLAPGKDDEAASDADSEDLEAESSGSEDEEEEDEGEAEAEGDVQTETPGDADMADGQAASRPASHSTAGASKSHEAQPHPQTSTPDVMVH